MNPQGQPAWLRVASAALCAALLVLPLCASADITKGLAWLSTQSNANGSFGGTPASLATEVRSTAEVLRAYQDLGQQSQPAYVAGLSFLNNDTTSQTRFLARKIIVSIKAGVDTTALVNALVANQNSDGGFGNNPGEPSTVLDTAFALEALASANYTSGQIAGTAVGYLLAKKQTNGGWFDGANATSVPLSAQVFRALFPYRNTFSGVSAALLGAQNFLLAQRTASNTWGESFETALVLQALIPYVSDLALIDSSAIALGASELADGSWASDAYTTALALQAMQAYQARKNGSPLQTGAVSGYVVRAGSSEPIANAQVSVVERPGVAVLSNGSGYFLIPGLPAGNYTISATKNGYLPASIATSAAAAQTTLAGNIVLGVALDTGLLIGKVFDSANLAAIPGAAVTISGPASLSAVTDTTGAFNFGAVAPGDYSFSIVKTGYETVSGTATVVGGQRLTLNQGLVKTGAFQDTDPGTVTGRAVSSAGLPIAGAVFDLGGGLAGTSGADGIFTVSNVPRGNYVANLNAAGYVPQSYVVAFPPGALGNLGDLMLYAASSSTAPTSLNLSVTVVDGVTRAPIAGASVRVVETGASAVTGADGRALLSGIAVKSFNLALSATGYDPATYAFQASAFGDAQATLALAPPGNGATTSTLTGTVTDIVTSAPIAGARVSIDGTSLSAITATNGSYTLNAIGALDFTLTTSAVGYGQVSSPVHLVAPGNYVLNPGLQPIAGTSFQILTVTANPVNVASDSTALFTAKVASLLSAPASALIVGEVVNAAGESIAIVTPYAEETTTPSSEFQFGALETKTLTIPWSTGQFAPGAYRLILRAVTPGSINQAQPLGQVLAENSAAVSITQTLKIGGALSINPPLVQAGLATPVDLTAIVRNAGNVPLAAGAYTLTVADPATGSTLYTTQVQGAALDVGVSTSVGFGPWTPTKAGDLPVTVRAQNASVIGAVTGTLYVGDKASGTFTINPSTVPEGTQTVHGQIELQGVDVTRAVSTDPLYVLTQEALKRGGQYTAPAATSWYKTNRCLGCHTATQSHLGLASAANKAEIDKSAVSFLANSIVSSQHNNGALYISHPEFMRTQTYLGTWALTASANKTDTFRSLYKASKFQTDTCNAGSYYCARSGSTSFWRNDHPSAAWWANDVAATALVVSGFAEVLSNAAKVDLNAIHDFGLKAGVAIGGFSNPYDIEVGPDGNFFIVKRSGGAVVRLNPATGQVTQIATGLGDARGIAVLNDGTIYVSGVATSTSGFLRRITTGGAIQNIPLGTVGALPEIELGPDGWLYVSDYTYNRILRVSPATGQYETFASGGLISGPAGLAFDAAGNLFVANHLGFNVLKIAPDKTVVMMADGLAGRPVYLDVTTDGQLYISLYNEMYPREAAIRVGPNGATETLFDAGAWSDYRGVLAYGGKVYFVNDGQNTLQELQVTPLATTSLDAFRTEGTRAANYFLGNYKDNSTDNVIQAMRMIGLAETRRFVTDTAVLANIDTAVAYEANLLRSLQRADGGWGRTRTDASDPLVSAMVGIALDHTNPSSSDPQVRKLIQYLLNTQAADGSWYNVNNGLTTRLGATSFVLAYLPKALDRLGGIDIDLHVVAPANVSLANISPAPTVTIPTADGGQEYIWKFLGVTAAGRRIDADFTLPNLAPNETRAVAQRAYLEFANSFTGDKLQTDLVVPTVHAQSSLGLGVSLGKTNYQANETMTIASTVTNTGPTAASGEVRLAIHALGSTTPLADLAPVPVANLAPGTQFTFVSVWNTGTILTGAYEVHGRLFDAQGRFVAESVAPFNIGAPASSVGVRLSTNKPVYNAWDTVDILALVQNTAPNAILAPTRAEITVTTPGGTTLYSATRSIGQIAPSGIEILTLNLPLNDAATGTYPVNLVLKDEFTRTVLTTASTSFQVQRQALQGITGTVTVSTAQVYQGDPVQCTDTAKNISGSGLTGAILTHQLVNMDLGTVVSQFSQTLSLPAGATSTYQKNIDTQGLAVGGYTCVLKAEVNGSVRTLAFAGFRVQEPPIRIDAELKMGTKGRLLVLLDNPRVCADGNGQAIPCKVVDADPFGPAAAPVLSAQRVFLEGVLKAEGWSYTITETADDFTREFHSGGYTVYALFTERRSSPRLSRKNSARRCSGARGSSWPASTTTARKCSHRRLGFATSAT